MLNPPSFTPNQTQTMSAGLLVLVLITSESLNDYTFLSESLSSVEDAALIS